MPRMKTRLLGLIAVFALAGASTPAGAASFSFSQGGYADGATVTGTFEGTDLDLNGQLSSFTDEVSAFSMSFSGNSLVPAFSLGFDELFGLVYDLGSGFLGDGTSGDSEGIAAEDASFAYETGQGPTGGDGGSVVDLLASTGDGTLELVTVVPEPSTVALLGLGLAGLALRGRRPKP